jgi:hypothetical protein
MHRESVNGRHSAKLKHYREMPVNECAGTILALMALLTAQSLGLHITAGTPRIAHPMKHASICNIDIDITYRYVAAK